MQVALVWSRLETAAELKTICVFHVIGLALELYKVNHGSWTYPEPALTKIAGVPLFSGFMYASVASYFVQAWRRFDLRFDRFPRAPWVSLVGVAIYLNFFLSRAFGDSRWMIVGSVFVLFGRTFVRFTCLHQTCRMPIVVGFFLVGLFVWFAENLCTYLGAWKYPHQQSGWEVVDLGKLSSWCLLVIVSFLLVAALKRIAREPVTDAAPIPATELGV